MSEMKQPDDHPPLRFRYTNWRGEVAIRLVWPIEWKYGSTEWHPESQWLLRAFDLDKQEIREFAASGIVGDIDHVQEQSWRKDRDATPFALDGDLIARLRALAESTRTSGRGTLASAEYHAQGSVGVPSAWLADILDRVTVSPEGGMAALMTWLSSDEARRLIETRIVQRPAHPHLQAAHILGALKEALEKLLPAGAAVSEVLEASEALRDSLADQDAASIARALPEPDCFYRLGRALDRLRDIPQEPANASQGAEPRAPETMGDTVPEAEFSADAPEQEALAIQFAEEIAGRKGERGSPPDPIRLLEMARALYQAEMAYIRGEPSTPKTP